jgi:hypothetical protein
VTRTKDALVSTLYDCTSVPREPKMIKRDSQFYHAVRCLRYVCVLIDCVENIVRIAMSKIGQPLQLGVDERMRAHHEESIEERKQNGSMAADSLRLRTREELQWMRLNGIQNRLDRSVTGWLQELIDRLQSSGELDLLRWRNLRRTFALSRETIVDIVGADI